jgi:hypothetical protein
MLRARRQKRGKLKCHRNPPNYVELKNYVGATTFGASSEKGKGGRVTVTLYYDARTLLHCDAI